MREIPSSCSQSLVLLRLHINQNMHVMWFLDAGGMPFYISMGILEEICQDRWGDRSSHTQSSSRPVNRSERWDRESPLLSVFVAECRRSTLKGGE